MILPPEILNQVLLYTDSRVDFAMGLIPPTKKLFLNGGGYSTVLKSILETDADLKSMLLLKDHVAPDLALLTAIETKTEWITKRVCIMWDIWHGRTAFGLSWHTGFLWGVDHIKPDFSKLLNVKNIYNRIYFELGLFDRMDLNVTRPFGHVSWMTNDYMKARRLDFAPFRETLEDKDLLQLYMINGDRKAVYSILEKDKKEKKRKLPLAEYIYSVLRRNNPYVETLGETLEYELPIELSREYNVEYKIDQNKVTDLLFSLRRVDIWEYVNDETTDIHRAFLTEDAATLNRLLMIQRKETLDILVKYGLLEDVYEEIMSNPDINLDPHGKWLGLTTTEDDGYYVKYLNWGKSNVISSLTDDAVIRDIPITHVNEYIDGDEFGQTWTSSLILKYLYLHGTDVLDDMTCIIPLVPSGYAEKLDFHTIMELISISLDRGYDIKRISANFEYYTPKVYIHEKSIHFEDLVVSMDMPHGDQTPLSMYRLQNVIMVQNRIILACREYYHTKHE